MVSYNPNLGLQLTGGQPIYNGIINRPASPSTMGIIFNISSPTVSYNPNLGLQLTAGQPIYNGIINRPAGPSTMGIIFNISPASQYT